MARNNYTTTSTVTLEVNAKQASQMMNRLKNETEELKKKFDKAKDAGDKVQMQKLSKSIKENEKLMDLLEARTAKVAEVLQRLDRATPKELHRTLKHLRKELNGMERGTEAWDAQIEKIRQVKEAIQEINEEINNSMSLGDRFKYFIERQITGFSTFFGWIKDATEKLEEFVKDYSEMQQEMANVQKYTGMNDSQVNTLNESFKQLDTRTSREELNLLAQEAGRLGKTSVEDVLGFVRAADKINVALDDLGDGATLILSKLTAIFGDEERLGTEKALLSVGSVVNELSQNCSASASYLTEFASRLGGVGSQAGMSVQQIMAFASVLDSNNQALEQSATAMSQLIVKLYQDPSNYAKVAGLEVKEFSELLKKDANEALITFLESLSKAGKMDTLSVMFKDMGEKGNGMVTTLSTLAGNISMVRDQQRAANEAFEEAISIDKEFEVQNTTVQAGYDKSKKALKEITIQLGEKLAPVLSLCYSSLTLLINVMANVVSFVIKNKTAFISLGFAIAGYTLAVNAAAIKTKVLTALNAAHAAVLTAERTAVLLVSAAYNLCTGKVTRAAAAWRMLNATLAASPWGLVIAVVSALIPLIVSLCKHTDTYVDKANKVIEKNKEISDSVVKEQRELGTLIGKLKAAEKGTEEYKKMKDQLISQYGRYLSGLIDEKGEIIDLARAYDVLSQAIDRSNRLRNIHNAKDELETEYNKSQAGNINALQKSLQSFGADPKEIGEIIFKVTQAVGGAQPIPKEIINKIESITNSENIQYTDDGVKLDKTNQILYKSLSWMPEQFFTVSKPTENLKKIIRDQRDYNQSQKNLDQVELEINPTKNISSDQLLKSYNALDDLVKGNATDFVSVPDYYIPDNVPDAYFGHVYEKDSEKRHKYAAQSRAKDAGKYVLRHDESPARSLKVDVEIRDKKGGGSSTVALSPVEAKSAREQIAQELRLRGVAFGDNPAADAGGNEQTTTGYTHQETEKERKKRLAEQRKAEAEARRHAIKEKKEFKDALKEIKAQRNQDEAEAKALRMSGAIDYRQYFELMREAQWDWHLATKQLYEQHHLEEDEEYKALLNKELDDERKYNEQRLVLNKESVERIAKVREQEVQADYAFKDKPTFADELAMKEQLLSIRFNKLMDLQKLYDQGSKEWEDYEMQIQDLLYQDMMDKRKTFAAKAAEFEQQFDKMTVEQKYKIQREALEALYKDKYISEEKYRRWLKQLDDNEKKDRKEEREKLPGSSKKESPKARASEARAKYEAEKAQLDKALADGMIDQDEYAARLRRIKAELEDALIAPLKESKSEWLALMAAMVDSWKDFADALKDPEGDPFDAIAKGIEATAAVMSAVMSQVSEFTKAQLEIQTAAVEKRYDREIAYAEGNAFLTKRLEKQKQKEIAQLKEEASNKQFDMQVIAAVAQTAANAIAAYGAAIAIGGVAGLVLAPIAAGLAVAQGAVQIATIKKQKEAAAATGYSAGGFTKKGAVDEPAGIVHAGEWVASQKLVNSPVARPMIDLLEYAQRTNRIGSISMEDVSRSITAPARMSGAEPQSTQVVVREVPANTDSPELSRLSAVVDRLAARLDEPFIANSYVAGPYGTEQAQQKYDRMMRNKSRKNRS